jgi:hypothetical protein
VTPQHAPKRADMGNFVSDMPRCQVSAWMRIEFRRSWSRSDRYSWRGSRGLSCSSVTCAHQQRRTLLGMPQVQLRLAPPGAHRAKNGEPHITLHTDTPSRDLQALPRHWKRITSYQIYIKNLFLLVTLNLLPQRSAYPHSVPLTSWQNCRLVADGRAGREQRVTGFPSSPCASERVSARRCKGSLR